MSKGKVADKVPVGIELEGGKDYFWCSCGSSKNQPWCDGSHKGTHYAPAKISIPETKTAYLCNCKQTDKPGFCDGSHKGL